MTSLFRSKYNWEVVDGDQNNQVTFSLKSFETALSISQDDLLDPDSCLVLESGEDQSFCEQVISIHPGYQLTAIALIAECCTIELYIGKSQEYNNTHHGELIFDAESKLYRFDISFDASKPTFDVTLRYIIAPGKNLCLYGTHLILMKKSNFLGNEDSINQAMLACHLDDTELSEKAVKCKAFLLASMERQAQQVLSTVHKQNTFNNNTTLCSKSAVQTDRRSIDPDDMEQHPAPESSSFFDKIVIKQYIDAKIAELEGAIDIKLKAMEVRQNQKLDKIISLLGCIENKQ
ncbi:uncharacterized protein LOC128745537 [Sabethes cyaneus]|uniref:uncharacterized protein LOC128745537 n=1 Tax=Sabethes cyaneus TaxID=53552 RepID=UPI00237DE9F7|nr:uncharacterized protein LOC128745537 [Sabethes cyaneus]